MLTRICGLIAALMLMAFPAAAEDWRRYETPNFVLYSNASQGLSTAYVTQLEQYRFILNTFYGGNTADGNAAKVPTYFLNSERDLRQLWPERADDVAGYMRYCSHGMAAFALNQGETSLDGQAITYKRQNSSQKVIFHEYAHYFMYMHSGLRYPPWFVEGFAEFYSTMAFEKDRVLIGMADDYNAGWLINGRWISFEDILNNDPSVRKGDRSAYFYAQSWLLTHYLLSDPQRKANFSAYLSAYSKGEDPVLAFERIMGIKVADLPKILRQYMRSMKAIIYRMNDLPSPQVAVTVLPRSGQKLLLWDAAITTCPSEAYGKKLLENIQEEAVRYPDDNYAQLVLARAEIIVGDITRAIDILIPLTVRDPQNAEAFSLLGQAWYQLTENDVIREGETSASQMVKARKALNTAYQLDPANARTLYYLSVAQQDRPGFPNETAVNGALEAHYLSPSIETYAYHAAQVLIVRDRMDEAKAIMFLIASNPHNEARAAWAREVIAAIEAGEDKWTLLKRFGNTPKSTDEDD